MKRTILAAASAAFLAGIVAAAQTQTPAPAFKRTLLQQADLSIPGREAVTALAELPPGVASGRHTHPGEEIAGAPLKLDQMGITHFSFTVPDPEALLEALVFKGATLGGPRASFTNREGRIRSFYVYDPDGIIIQFDSGLNEG